MKPNYIFGLTKRLLNYEEPIRSGWVIDAGHGEPYVDMGTPCLVIRYPEDDTVLHGMQDLRRRDPHKIALVPFYFGTRMSGKSSGITLDNHNNVSNLSLRVGEETDFFDTIKEIEVEKLDVDKVKKAVTFVREQGPLTLLSGAESSMGDLKRFFNDIYNSFSFSCAGRLNAYGRKSLIPGDKCLLAVTLMDIGQCLPIYDPSKVDGVLANFTILYTASCEYKDKLISSCSVNLLFSNHETNIIKIDGQRLGRATIPWGHVTKMIDSLKENFRQVGEIRQDEEVKKDRGRGRKKSLEELVLRKSAKPPSAAPSPSARYYYTTTATNTTTTGNGW